jgi:hypothetical protein
LKENITTLKKSIDFFQKNYNIKFIFIIVPEIEINDFTLEFESLIAENKIKIIDEKEILNLVDFTEIYESINTNSFGNTKWYYQQFLKILFTLHGKKIHSDFNYPVVMFEADSYPIKKIKFFDKDGKINLYGSLLEKHEDYIKVLRYIYGVNFNIKSGYTVQFFSCDNSLRDLIINLLFINNNNFQMDSKECSKKLLELIHNYFGEINGQKFSEQEFFGIAEMLFKNNLVQIPLLSFRPWNLDSYLTKKQEFILKLFCFSLITCEKQKFFKKDKFLDNITFIKLLFSSLLFQLRNYINFYLR